MAIDDALLADLRATAIKSVGVITGAGISAESGIATYRGSGGLYDDPEEGDRTVEALTGSTLESDPERTWGVLRGLAASTSSAEPNAAHHALVRLEEGVARFTLLTQNVDGLHARAGQQHIIEIHGNTFDLRCTRCAWHHRGGGAEALASGRIPTCPACHAPARPDVVLFGEMLDVDRLDRIHRHFYEDKLDLLLVVGTSALFPYIVGPVLHAREQGIRCIEVNPEATDLSAVVHHHVSMRAGAALPLLVDAIISDG